jgi:hypothetical protein
MSLFAGLAITLGVSIVMTLILFRGDTDAVVPGLLFWPVFLMDKLGFGLGCADANSVSEKLACIRTALLIDVVLYPAMICILAFVVRHVFGRAARLRQSHVAN